MKNYKAFTLVSILAVVVILGILMMIAIPNTLSMIDKNKMSTYIENAKTFVSLVKNKVQTDKSLEIPYDSTGAFVMSLGYLNTNDINETPYGGEYDKDASFVAILFDESSHQYKYYVHLVSCLEGTSCSKSDPNHWRGIDLVEVTALNLDSRFDYVSPSGVKADYITGNGPTIDLSSVGDFSGKTLTVMRTS